MCRMNFTGKPSPQREPDVWQLWKLNGSLKPKKLKKNIVSELQQLLEKPGSTVDLRGLAQSHLCWSHPLFARLEGARLTTEQCAALLRNYDEHAGALRRLLLKAATIMPEEAVTYVLENVRNEYGNGNPA